MTDRGEALRALLEAAAPDGAGARVEGAGGPPEWAADSLFTLRTRRPWGDLHLGVVLRHDGDVDVHLSVPAHQPDWVEAHFVVPDAEERPALEEIARFVGDLLRERMVLAYDDSFFRGGRHFIPADRLDPARRHRLAWTVSWRGTYDWRRPGSSPPPRSPSP